jgi:signal transduction histidine kinase
VRATLSRLTLRARLMLIGVSGVAVSLGLGGALLYGVLGLALHRTIDAQATTGAREVAALVDRGQLPDPLPVSGAQVAQVVDAHHRVLSASLGADKLTSLLRPAELSRAGQGETITVPGSRVGLSGPLRVVALKAGRSRAAVTVVVGQQAGNVAQSQRVLRDSLLIAYPLLLLVLALIAWYVIGWTLQPVEALRRGAERISGSGDEERLPVPVSTDEIAALATTLNDMLDRLSEAHARQRAFVADAAHELRSPLTSLRTQLEVAQHVGDDSALVADTLSEVRRLAALTEDLLLLAKSGGSAVPVPVETFAVAGLLDEVVARRADSRVPVTLLPAPSRLSVTANRDELRRVLDNLVDNAVRHAASRVELAASEVGARTLLTVVDDGPGVDPADRERVFDRFARLDDARDRDAGGAGLGLAIVRELLRRVGGTVRLDAASPGDASPGLRVEVLLPR